MLLTLVPLSQRLTTYEDTDCVVATGKSGSRTRADFTKDVSALMRRIRLAGGRRWLVAERDPYALAVGVFAALHADCQAVLPANLQSGHLAELSATTEGVISSGLFTDREGGLQTFDETETESDGLTALSQLDADRAEITLHTSGTTGVPIAVKKPLRCLEAELAALSDVFPPSPKSLVLASVPPYHIYGLLFRVLWPLASGRPFATDTISYPEELTAAARRHPGCTLVSSPAFLKRAAPLLNLDELKDDLARLFSSGGLLPPAVAASYNASLADPIAEIYGSTETGGIAYRSVRDSASPPPWKPLPGVEVAVDERDQVLAVRSPFLAEHDWLLTSDRAKLYPDGRFELLGRADRVVKLEEVRVSLPEMEKRFAECPEVEAARVVQLPEKAGRRQVLGAVVQPSATGWTVLRAEGRQNLRHRLTDPLAPHLPLSVLPRRWRFVTQMPEDDRGKTSETALLALFEDPQGRKTEPVVLAQKVEGNTAALRFRLPNDLFYFEGHFDDAPILAGVVQLDWAFTFAAESFGIEGRFRRIEALKFFNVLMAGDEAVLELQLDQAAERVRFRYYDGETKYSSGRILFETEP